MPGSNVTQLQWILGRNTHQPLTQYFAHLKKTRPISCPFSAAHLQEQHESIWG